MGLRIVECGTRAGDALMVFKVQLADLGREAGAAQAAADTRCPACGGVIGVDPFVRVEDVIYHNRCYTESFKRENLLL